MTYARIICNVRPQKEEVNRTRLTMGGNLINVPMEGGLENWMDDFKSVVIKLNLASDYGDYPHSCGGGGDRYLRLGLAF